MAISFTTLATRLGSDVAVLNAGNTLNASNQSTLATALQTHAQALVVQYVLADRPQTGTSFAACYEEWVRQMVNSSESFAASTCTPTVAAVGSPTGTPAWQTSDLDATGARSDFLVPDVLVLRATSATAVSVQGKSGPTTATSPAWGVGANVSTSLSLVDPSVTSSGSDPDFNTWTGSPLALTSWSIPASGGTFGTDIYRVTDGLFDTGGYAVEFLGTTSALRLRQNVSTLTSGVYAVHAALKKVVDSVDTGTVSITLRDASGNVLSATGISQAFSGLTTGVWTPVTAAVYVPRQLTDGAWLEIRWTGGTSDTLRVDCVSLTPMTRLYTAGLSIAGFMGVTDLILDTDQWTVTTALDSGSMTGKLAKGLDRLLGIAGATSRLPTSGSPTQADALIA